VVNKRTPVSRSHEAPGRDLCGHSGCARKECGDRRSQVQILGKRRVNVPITHLIERPTSTIEEQIKRNAAHHRDLTSAIVSDWNGGAFGVLPDCKVGVQLRPDPKTSPDAVEAASSDKEFASNDPAIKATRPTVREIIVGY
jgi:hypothetical protein